jgi:hypothetical protein
MGRAYRIYFIPEENMIILNRLKLLIPILILVFAGISCSESSDSTDPAYLHIYNNTNYAIYSLNIGGVVFATIPASLPETAYTKHGHGMAAVMLRMSKSIRGIQMWIIMAVITIRYINTN